MMAPPIFTCEACGKQTRPAQLRLATGANGWRATLACGCDVGGEVAGPMLETEDRWQREQDEIHAKHLASCPCHACTIKQVAAA